MELGFGFEVRWGKRKRSGFLFVCVFFKVGFIGLGRKKMVFFDRNVVLLFGIIDWGFGKDII